MTEAFDCTLLLKSAEELNIEITQRQIEKFSLYADMLVEWNKKVNLTAITSPDGIAVRHFADSLTLINALDIPQNAYVIDVGTGAGFPGIPLKIMRPDINLTLLDSLNKRLLFLDEVLKALKFSPDSVKTVHFRAEEAGRNPEFREKYDIAAARAVAGLSSLCEYCLPLVKCGGCFAAMKGPDCADEISASENALEILGAEIKSQSDFTLADGSGRKIIVCEKLKPTPQKYPRQSGKISKSPL